MREYLDGTQSRDIPISCQTIPLFALGNIIEYTLGVNWFRTVVTL